MRKNGLLPVFCFKRKSDEPVKGRKKTITKPSTTDQVAISNKSWQAIVVQAEGLARRLCEAEGMELVHVEFQREAGGRILRLYIDQPGGVTLKDCVNISRQLGDLLDVTLEDVGPYNLEVSSPGTDRPLSKASDYDRFKGNVAKIKTTKPIGGQKNFKGVLSGISGGIIILLIGDGMVAIPLKEIARARLVDYHGESQC